MLTNRTVRKSIPYSRYSRPSTNPEGAPSSVARARANPSTRNGERDTLRESPSFGSPQWRRPGRGDRLGTSNRQIPLQRSLSNRHERTGPQTQRNYRTRRAPLSGSPESDRRSRGN